MIPIMRGGGRSGDLPSKLMAWVPILVIAGIGYWVYKKFFALTDEEKREKERGKQQLVNDLAVADKITKQVVNNTLNVSLAPDQASSIANSVHYYCNSLLMTEGDRDAVKTLLLPLNAANLRQVSLAYDRRKLSRFFIWFDNDSYDLKQTLQQTFGMDRFNKYFSSIFKLANL